MPVVDSADFARFAQLACSNHVPFRCFSVPPLKVRGPGLARLMYQDLQLLRHRPRNRMQRMSSWVGRHVQLYGQGSGRNSPASAFSPWQKVRARARGPVVPRDGPVPTHRQSIRQSVILPRGQIGRLTKVCVAPLNSCVHTRPLSTPISCMLV